VAPNKSLFRNILPVSPSGSRFCAGSRRSSHPKLFETNNLGIQHEKNHDLAAPLTPALSGFCPQNIEPQGLPRRPPNLMIPIDRGGRGVPRGYHKVNTTQNGIWNRGGALPPAVPFTPPSAPACGCTRQPTRSSRRCASTCRSRRRSCSWPR